MPRSKAHSFEPRGGENRTQVLGGVDGKTGENATGIIKAMPGFKGIEAD
jgi:hypothetical protein